MSTIAQQLRSYRRGLGLSQGELARYAGIAPENVCRLEGDGPRDVTLELLRRIASVLGPAFVQAVLPCAGWVPPESKGVAVGNPHTANPLDDVPPTAARMPQERPAAPGRPDVAPQAGEALAVGSRVGWLVVTGLAATGGDGERRYEWAAACCDRRSGVCVARKLRARAARPCPSCGATE